MHIIQDAPDTVPLAEFRRAPMPYKPRYEDHTAECSDDDEPTGDRSMEMLGLAIVAGVCTMVLVIALVSLWRFYA